jgi:hypothetical protein
MAYELEIWSHREGGHSYCLGAVRLLGEDAHLIGQSALGHGRMSESRQIDFGLVKKWLRECKYTHEQCMKLADVRCWNIFHPV